MSRLERCGAPYSHLSHQWQEGPAWDLEIHVCDGVSEIEESLDAHEIQDSLADQGAY